MSNKIVKYSKKYLVKPRGRKIAEADWNKHRDKILHLWLEDGDEGRTLDEIVEIMSRDHNFSATASQYHNRIVKKWLTRKNITKKEWYKLYYEERRRIQSGSSTTLRFNNRLITDETKEREWARYAFATETENAAGLSPLPAAFEYEDINAPNESNLNEYNFGIATTAIVTSRSPVPFTTEGFSKRPVVLSDVRPFSWGLSIDWNMLARAMNTDAQLVRSWKPDPNRLSAMFYPQIQASDTLASAGNALILQHLISSIVNGVGHIASKCSSQIYLWLASLPRQPVLDLFWSFPNEIIDVICQRIRITAISDTIADKAKQMLALEQDIRRDKALSAEEITAVFLALARGSPGDVIEVVVRYATNMSDNPDMVLQHVFKYVPNTFNYVPIFFNYWPSIRFTLEAGAMPTKECFLRVRGDDSILDTILSFGRNDILAWIRAGLLDAAVHSGAYHQNIDTVKWVLTRMVGSIHQQQAENRWSSDDAMAINNHLSKAFRTALQYSWKEPMKAIYDCYRQLNHQPAYSQTDWLLNEKILLACYVGDYDRANSYLRHPDVPVQSDSRPSTMSAELHTAILSDDWRQVKILLPEETQFKMHALDIALREGSDEVAVLLASDSRSYAILKILSSASLRVADRLIALHSHVGNVSQDLRLTSDYTDLEDWLYRREPHEECVTFPCSHGDEEPMELQIILRTISYYAIHRHDIKLLDWLCNQGLAVGALDIDHDAGDIDTIRATSTENEKFITYGKGIRFDTYHEKILLPSLLEVAIKQGDQAMLQYFLNVSPAQRESRALLCAVKARSHLAVQELLQYEEHNTPSTKRSQYGSAALRVAIRNRDYTLVRILAKVTDMHGIEKIDFKEECSVLDWLDPLGEAVLRDDREAVQILLEHGADPDAVVAFRGLEAYTPRTVDNSILSRVTPLLVAIDLGSLAMVEFLLRHGATINRELDMGLIRTPLQRAAEIGEFGIVRYLIEQGAIVDTTPPYGGGTALQLAAMSVHVGIATLLIQSGADVNHIPARGPGRTAFEAAAEWCRLDMMYLLVHYGAQLDLEIIEEVEERDETNDPDYIELRPMTRWHTVRKARTQYERAIAFAEERRDYASKRIVQNLWVKYWAGSNDAFLEIEA